MKKAVAILRSPQQEHVLPFYINAIKWGYSQNVKRYSTLGGKVFQMLSVRVDDMVVGGDAGTRKNLQRLADVVDSFMEYHAASQKPIDFIVSSRKWHFRVFIVGMPNVGWDLATVKYPWMMQMKVDEDLGIFTQRVLSDELNRLAKDIGYNPAWAGGEGIDALVKNTSSQSDIGKVYIPNGSIEHKIRYVWGPVEGDKAIRVARCESSLNPRAITYEDNGSISRGLFQINSIHAGTLYPKNEEKRLFEVDYNITVAYRLWRQQGWKPWSCAKKLGIV